MNKLIATLCVIFTTSFATAQNYWQQAVDYKMDVHMNVKNYQYKGTQRLVYTNNSPDTLNVVFYHLYFNAFQPGSEMDSHLQSLPDPDPRMATNVGTKDKPQWVSRISQLKPNEVGYLKVLSLTQDGQSVSYEHASTILKVKLAKPILPKGQAVFEMTFEGQVPVMIRRAGRNSPDGVALSMAQWYPKMVAYDFKGWHATEYLGREFYGVWGDFDVKITIDKNYILGGSGVLQNPNEVGCGYEEAGAKVPKVKSKTKTWHFVAKRVHDFTWSADPEYVHDKVALKDGKTFHFLYKKYKENWKRIQPEMVKVYDFYNTIVGKYPWEQYTFLQGGDGGMEYAMCTLIVGNERYESLLGTAIHELGHAWFQHLLGTDEATYPWMDEGFTSFIEDLAKQLVIHPNSGHIPFGNAYKAYFTLATSQFDETPITHSDRYASNYAYSINSYRKGTLFLTQLGYIIGDKVVIKALQEYYKQWAFKSPTPNDFIRIAEKVSGMQLQWFLNEFMQTTHTADYAVESVKAKGNKTEIVLKRIGRMPLPIDLFVVEKSKKVHYYYIPLRMQFGNKPNPYMLFDQEVMPAWGWGNTTYTLEINMPLEKIQTVAIDADNLSVDINKANNVFQNP